jgi:predicted phage gp36 major capsid-like protein
MTDKEDINTEELRKTARMFYRFQELPIQDVAAIADEAFTEENQEKGQHYYDKNIERQSKYAQDMKQKQSKERTDILQHISDLSKHFGKGDLAGGRAKAIAHVAKKYGKTEADIHKLIAGKR